MSTTLYRKYRPQRFADLTGQRHIRTTLMAEIASGHVAHAYVFVGPRGVGKTTTARLLAKAVNCASLKDSEPDNRCESCTAMNAGRSLDLVEIDAASHTQVDHVRENILPAARTAPTTGKYKVFIIDEVHMLSTSAFNALLKMLEEPPAHVIFILATTEVHRIPETILSRCQRFDFRRIGHDDMVERLRSIAEDERVNIESSVLDRVARLAGGSQRDAESMLGQLIGLGEKNIGVDQANLVLPHSDVQAVIEFLDLVLQRRAAEALTKIQTLIDEGIHLGFFLKESIRVMRSIMLLKFDVRTGFDSLSAAADKKLTAIAEATSLEDARLCIEILIRRELDERSATIPQLPLELAVAEFVTDTSVDRSAPEPKKRVIPTIEEKKKSSSDAKNQPSAGVNLAEWPKIVDRVQSTNPSIAVLLKSGKPYGIVDGVLTLAFAFPFHRERALDQKNRAFIESILTEVTGESLTLDAIVDATIVNEPSAPPANETGDVWEQALQVFGGEAASTDQA